MKKRWLCIFVESEIGVLAKICGLFSAKAYNLDSLTVGVTEDPSVSRMTISLTSDDQTFEQVKKQLNRSIEVIKVLDYTDASTHRKELMFLHVTSCTETERSELFRIAEIFHASVIDYSRTAVLLQSVQPECQNNDLIARLEPYYGNRIAIIRGGTVAVEALHRAAR